MDFCHLQEICLTNMENNYQILIQKQDYMLSKTSSKKGVNNEAEAAGKFIRKKISDEILKQNL